MFLEYNIFRNKELETNFEFGLGFNNWFRGNSNYSIQEIYRWYYTTIGLNNNFKINDNYDIGLNLNYNKSFKGNLYTNMLGAEKFDLDNINGYKVSIPLTSKITKDIYFVLEYAYEYIEIGKSDFKSALFSDGIRRNVYEPDSTTNSNTISTRIKFSF